MLELDFAAATANNEHRIVKIIRGYIGRRRWCFCIAMMHVFFPSGNRSSKYESVHWRKPVNRRSYCAALRGIGSHVEYLFIKRRQDPKNKDRDNQDAPLHAGNNLGTRRG